MKKHIKPLSAAGLVCLLGLTACGAPPGTGDADGAQNGTAEGEPLTLVVAQAAEPTTMDPHDADDGPTAEVTDHIFSRMFVRNDDMDIEPYLVTDYDQIDDETWTFTIRDDYEFHNGDPLTAADIEFSLNRVTSDEALREYSWFRQISGAEATDDYEVQITTDGPMPTLPILLAKTGSDILPSEYVEEVGMEEFTSSPIGSGPYEFAEWRQDDHILLERFDDYPGDFWSDGPVWDTVELRSIPETSTRVSEGVTGGVDLATDIPPSEWERLEAEDDITLAHGESTRTMLMILRLTEGYVTEHPEIREAMELAVDSGAIAEALFEGEATPVRIRVPEGIFGYNPDLYDTYLYDPDRAREIVEEFGEPVEVTLTAGRGRWPLDAEAAEMVAAYLEDVGISVNLQILEAGAFQDTYANQDNEEIIMTALADGLLDASYSMNHFTQQRAEGETDYHNPDVEDRLQEALRTLDQDVREELYHEAQEMVAEDRPHIALYTQPNTYAVNDSVNFEPRLDAKIIFDRVTPAD